MEGWNKMEDLQYQVEVRWPKMRRENGRMSKRWSTECGFWGSSSVDIQETWLLLINSHY